MKTYIITLLMAVAAICPERTYGMADGNRSTEPADTLHLSHEMQRKFDYIFFEAQRQRQLGNHAATFDLLTYCREMDPQSAAVCYELSNYWLYLKEEAKARECLEQAVALEPDNYWYKNALVRFYMGKSLMDEALPVLEGMIEQFPEKSELLMMLMGIYHDKQDYANVIKTLNRLETKEGKSEQLSMEKFRIYVQMKDEKNAFKEMSDLAAEYPNDLRYKVLIGDLYLDNDKPEQAYRIYKEVSDIDPANINVMLSLASYYEKTGDNELYQKQLEQLVSNPQLDKQTRLSLMNSFVYQDVQNGGDSVKILRLFEKALESPQTDVAMTELCVRYMVTKKMPQAEIKPLLYNMLEIDPENDLARNQLLSYALQEEDTMGIIHICKPATEYGADDPVYYYYLGIAYFQQDSTQLAIEALRGGLAHVDENSSVTLLTNLYSILGDLYHEAGEDEKAFEAYDSCLIYRPDDALVLNNYAYYLSLHKRDLKKAEEMSARSLEKSGDNPTYLDTFAWILFQQKRYSEAQVYIDSALVLLGDSITKEDANIVEHAGDIYFKAGRKEQAVDWWKKARELNGGKASEALEQKIRKQKL
ncbi:MAG: hypothetical protein NC206_03120 [Bacteroides sp.]|nr:hypothetical protein [Roseburia sp.]MCM1346056.1 hypothetical protein [Bacteroides sp.]MCM1420578.1 hypothetical protein [Bacteroides sp.]